MILAGHVDVVPPGDPASWSRPAFEPWVEDGRLYGRGACDMKGGLVAVIEAVRRVRESGRALTGEIVVLAVPSEEDGGAGSLAAIRAGYVGDACVNCRADRVGYGADMRLFINQGATPTVMFGPGDVRVAHAADEHVPLAEVETCAATLTQWLLDVNSAGG